MVFHESETVELKEIVIDDIKKEIVAFANCEGGKIFIGVRDDGEVVGLEDADQTALQISNMVCDSIKPDLTMFIHYETLEVDGKDILSIEVQRGVDRPYYLAKKGMRPEGVYLRQGYFSAPASDAAIRRMIKETDGDSFEEMRSLNQELSFEEARKEFSLRNLEFGQAQMRFLKLIDRDGLYSNLALLLSDQCTHSIKVAVFQGSDQAVFKDRREFTGSLLKQLNDVYDFIDIHNQNHASIERLIRIDTRDYPGIAIREALLNLIVHRDYSYSASSLISIYSDRIEFVSIGGLAAGIEEEDIMLGLSVCRNQNLANVFYRLQLIEAYGTGIARILGAYQAMERKPRLSITRNAFKITLPNTNAMKGIAMPSEPLNGYCREALEYVSQHGSATRQEIAGHLRVSNSTAGRVLSDLVERGLLLRTGMTKNARYTMPEGGSI